MSRSIFRPRKSRAPRVAGALLVVVVVVVGGALTFGRSKSTSPGTRLNVVAGENFWGNITAQIGGSHVAVTSILSDPSTDPHLYESDASTAAKVSGADLVIANGVGYDDFLDKLVSASPNSHRKVLSMATALKVSGDNPNPHLWYDVPHVNQAAKAIEEALAAQDPRHAKDFKANLTRFDQSLKPILAVIASIKTDYPGAPVAYTERVPGYLLAASGLEVKTPPGFAAALEDGNDPSPADVRTMNDLMTNRGVKVLLYNSQATSAVTVHVRALAKQVGVPIVAVTETIPPSEKTYQSWQLDQARAIEQALSQ